MKKIKVGLQGRNGRVGKILTATMGEAPYSTHFEFVPDFKKTAVDVIIDFSSPAGTLEAARWCAEKKIPLVSGTTGLSAGETRSLEKFSQQTPILWSANFSLGVSALALALTTFAQNYDPSEIVIEETHHINKKDAPSGTAKFFYEVLQKLKLKIKIPNPMSHRVGESLGEHKIVFQGAGERVTFIHEATERALFAKGALDVAFWLVTQTEARFYNMLDFLKLRRLGDAPKIDLQIRHPHSTLICLGANLGDRRHILQQALERISFVASIHKISDVYETYSRFEQFHAPYLNCCVEVSTDMTSSQLLLFLIETQRQLSADQVVADPRSSIDLDLIAYDQDIIRTPQLTLPHPESHRRAYVMIPLAQIQPHWTHPILKKTAEELARTSHWDGWGTFFMQGKRLLDF